MADRNWATGATPSGTFSDSCSGTAPGDCYISFTGTITFLRAAPLVTEVKVYWSEEDESGGGTGYTSLLVNGSWTSIWNAANPNGWKTTTGSWANVTGVRVSFDGGAGGGLGTFHISASAISSTIEANGANAASSQGIQIL